MIKHIFRLASLESKKSDSSYSHLLGFIDSKKKILWIAASCDDDKEISFLSKSFKLFREDIFESFIICPSCEYRHIIIERDSLEFYGFVLCLRILSERRLLEIGDHMARCRGASSVSRDEDLFPSQQSFLYHIDSLDDIRRFHCLEYLYEIIHILLYEPFFLFWSGFCIFKSFRESIIHFHYR